MRTVMQLRAAARLLCVRGRYQGTILARTANADAAWRMALAWQGQHQAGASLARRRQGGNRRQGRLTPVGTPPLQPEIDEPASGVAPTLDSQWLARLFAARQTMRRNDWLSNHPTLPWAHTPAAPIPLASDGQPLGKLPPPADIHSPHPPSTLDARAAVPDAPLPHEHNVGCPTAVQRTEVTREHGGSIQNPREEVDARPTPRAGSMHFSCPLVFGDAAFEATSGGTRSHAGVRVTDNCEVAERHVPPSLQLPAVGGNGGGDAQGGTRPSFAQPFLWTLPPLTFAENRDSVPVQMRPLRHRNGGVRSARHARHSFRIKGFPAGWYRWKRRARRSRLGSKAAASELRAHAHAAAQQGALGADLWL